MEFTHYKNGTKANNISVSFKQSYIAVYDQLNKAAHETKRLKSAI